MDPNETLRRARSFYRQRHEAARMGNEEAEKLALEEIADAFEALDEWLSRGGFWPSSWGGKKGGAR